MEKRKEYMTAQKQRLIEFLRENRGVELSIDDIAEINSDIGRSTIYRLMSKLVAEGHVNRFVHDGSRKFVYQLVCCNGGEPAHYHLKCTSCGKLVHMGDAESKLLQAEVLSHYGFLTDDSSTMLLGCCSDCSHRCK